MGRLGLAFKILFSAEIAQRALAALSSCEQQAADAVPLPAESPGRSEAVTLLAALQRDARFVDFIQEDIDAYNDAQVGAAVRDIHRGCREVLRRIFAPKPVVDQEENSDVQVKNPSAGCWRLSGNVDRAGKGNVTGKLMHPGWRAAECKLPEWAGSAEDALVISPAEVHVS